MISQAKGYGCPAALSHPVRADDRVPLPVPAAEHRAGAAAGDHRRAVAQDPQPALSPDGAVLDQGLRAHLRHRRGHGHRDGVRVRHQLGHLLALRGRRVRQRAGGGGHLRVLPGIGLPRGAAVRLGPVGPGVHFFATCMVCLGAHFSAIWIVVANSWMQTPAGYHIVGEGLKARAEITDFWEMVFNPSSMDRLLHVLCGAWQAGAFLVVSVSAWYLLKRRHEEFARASLRVGLVVGDGRVAAATGQRPQQRGGRGEEPAGQAGRLRGPL